MDNITFQYEKFKDVFDEVLPLIEHHKNEIKNFSDIANLDYEFYFKLQDLNRSVSFTVRDTDKLIGYCLFTIFPHKQYNGDLHAKAEFLFLEKEYRGDGLGSGFLQYCDSQLKNNNIKAVHQSVTTQYDFAKTLVMNGYHAMETVYIKEL